MYDLAIHGPTYSQTLQTVWVYVKAGKIAAVSHRPKGRARATLELKPGEMLLPAATDLHVHLRDWRQASKETVASGTMSALAGGVTTVAEMPNTDPRIDSAEMIAKRIDLLRKRSYVDFALHAGVPEEGEEIRKFRMAGAFAVKFYPPDLARLGALRKLIEGQGLRTVLHAEDASLIGTRDEEKAEVRAVEKIMKRLDSHSSLRFAHISTPEAVRMIRSAGSPALTIEAAPHHLFTTEERAEARIGRASVVRPPLRSAANSRRMVRLLKSGRLDFYATDHAPHTMKEKGSVAPAPGFPGLEIGYPLLLSRTNDLELSCRVFCENPARYLGIRKGIIARGYLADLVTMRKRSWVVDSENFISKARVTPFQGELLRYTVTRVIKGGEVVLEHGRMHRPQVELVGQQGA